MPTVKDSESWNAKREARMARLRARHAGGPPMVGIILMAVGAIFLLGNLGIIYVADIWQFWPVILIVLGVSKMAPLRSFGETLWGGVIAGIGGVFLLRNLDILQGNVWQFIWPMILIAVGASMLVSRLDAPAFAPAARRFTAGEPFTGTVGGDYLSVELVFSGTKRKVESQDFKGGKIATVFGAAEIDLRLAATKLEEVVIKADAVFGSIELWVPDTWLTVVRGSGVFGAFEDKTHPPNVAEPGKAPRLIVKGGAVFGGVIVRN
jgi:hypothetical protein